MNAKHLPVLLYGLAVLLAVFAYFYGLDSQYIPKNGDEYPYAHITRLTAESGHLLPLQSQLDHMRDTKPPLLFWLIAAVIALSTLTVVLTRYDAATMPQRARWWERAWLVRPAAYLERTAAWARRVGSGRWACWAW